jgi:hypothetical protein
MFFNIFIASSKRSAMTDGRTAGLALPRHPAPAKWAGVLQRTILGAIGLVLTWEVISRSGAAYLADVAPEAALWLDAQQPTALINLADRILKLSEETNQPNAGPSDQAAQRALEVRALVESAVLNEPINARAARIL